MGQTMQRLWNFLGLTEDELDAEAAPDEEPRRRRTPVISLHTQRQMEIVVLQPRFFDEARGAADYLKVRRPLVVNLGDADRELAKRIVDFLSGVTYALDGHVQRVGEEIFLFTPSNIPIAAEEPQSRADGQFRLE